MIRGDTCESKRTVKSTLFARACERLPWHPPVSFPLLPATAASLPCTGNTQQSQETPSAQTYGSVRGRTGIPAKKHITSHHTLQQNPIPLLPTLPPSAISSISPQPSKRSKGPIFPPFQGWTLPSSHVEHSGCRVEDDVMSESSEIC